MSITVSNTSKSMKFYIIIRQSISLQPRPNGGDIELLLCKSLVYALHCAGYFRQIPGKGPCPQWIISRRAEEYHSFWWDSKARRIHGIAGSPLR